MVPKETGTVGNWSKNRDHSDYRIVEIGQNIENSPGGQRRLAVVQTPVKNGLISIKDGVDTSIRHLKDFIKKDQRKTEYKDQK